MTSGQELAENRKVEVDQAGRENRRMEFIPLKKKEGARKAEKGGWAISCTKSGNKPRK